MSLGTKTVVSEGTHDNVLDKVYDKVHDKAHDKVNDKVRDKVHANVPVLWQLKKTVFFLRLKFLQ